MNRLEQFLEKEKFMNGVCISWFGDSYSCDIGYSEYVSRRAGRCDENGKCDDSACRYDAALIKRVLQESMDMGFNVVRLWLFEVMEGVYFDDEGRVIGIQPIFLRNLHEICTMAKRMNLPLVITFQPHISICLTPEEYPQITRHLFEPDFTESFMQNAIRPVAEMLKEFDNVILYDMYAEPEGDVRGPDGNHSDTFGGTWDQIRYFIARGAKLLKEISPDIPVTACAGWQMYRTLRQGRYNGLGLDYIGVDIYNNTGELEPVETLGCEVPVWLSEYGQENDETLKILDDDVQVTMMDGFVRNACEKGYVGAFYYWHRAGKLSNAVSLVSADGEPRKAVKAMPEIFREAKKLLPEKPAWKK